MKYQKILMTSLICFCVANAMWAQQNFSLIYDKPAEKWTEALPIGNGSLGAMIYGGVQQEHIQFNEETLWAGRPHDYSQKGANKYLLEIRQLFADGKQKEAQDLAQEKFMSTPLKQKPYHPFGDLYITFIGYERFANYQRNLDLDQALVNVSYIGECNINFTREF